MIQMRMDSGELSVSEQQQISDWCDAVNSTASHQQDLIGSDLGVARTLAPGTHASGPHLTKTLINSNAYGVVTKGNGDAFINADTATALSTSDGEPRQWYPCVLQVNSNSASDNKSYVEVETEVTVRKYPVDIENLKKCLRSHKMISTDVIAEKLNKPKTLVEHWFRQDKCFAIPDADIWYQLKELLNIETTEFDESITTFEIQPGKFDMGNRIYMGDTTPTLIASSANTMYCVNTNGGGQVGQEYPYVLEDKPETGCLNPWDIQSKHIQPEDGIAESLYAAECRYGGGESYVMQTGSYQDTTGALCAAGYSKLGVQEAANDMYVVTSPTPQNVTYAIDRASFNQGQNAKYDFSIEKDVAQTLVARGPGGVMTNS